MQEVTTEPDIMGEFRSEVEMFYKRDEVVVAEERNFVLETFFSDLVFSRDMRVTCVRYYYYFKHNCDMTNLNRLLD